MKSQSPPYICNMFIFSPSPRNPQIIYPRIFTAIYEKSFPHRVANLWNALPMVELHKVVALANSSPK